MLSAIDREREIRRLVTSSIARDDTHAAELLDEMAAKRERADMVVLYSDVHPARELLNKHILDERPYNSSKILVATIPSGSMSQVIKAGAADRTLVLGKLTEFVVLPRGKPEVDDGGGEARLVAVVKGFPVEDKSGIFFSPFSAEAVHIRGGQTFDEKHNLFRIEFEPIGGDFVLGMFSAWAQHPLNDTISLALYMSRSKVIAF